MHSKLFSRSLRQCKIANLTSPIKPYNLLSILSSCGKHTENKYVLRNNYKLISPKFRTHSYALSECSGLHLLCDTIGDRLKTLAAEKPGNVAYKFCLTQTSFTFKELKQRVDEIAQNLLSMGFQKGDRLAIMLPNLPELNLTLLAASSVGIIAVLMNPGYQQVEIDYMLKKTKAKGLVIMDNLKTINHYSLISKICPELTATVANTDIKSTNLPDLKHVFLVPSRLVKSDIKDYKGVVPFAIIEKLKSKQLDTPHVDFDDTFVLMFTSGTTGLPKAAALSHYNVINTAYLDIYNAKMIDESNSICVPVPIFHLFGLITGVVEPLICGGKGVFPHILPDTLSMLKAVHAEKCTAIKGAPVIFIDMLNHPESSNYDLSSLKYMLMGASTVPRDLAIKLRDIMKIPNIIIGYGLTESSAAGIITRPDYDEKESYETVGQPFPFMECKIVNAKNQLLPVNTEGEICLRGFGIMKGYWDEPKKTAEAIDENGWLHTGDVGLMDKRGFVTFKSRAKEIIIRGGTNIYPAEIESFVRTNDQILDAYCFGIPDKRFGEEVGIWIKLKPNATLTREDFIEFCKGKIANFKIPKYIKFVDRFPINANGKVQKFKIIEQIQSKLKLKYN